MRKKRLIQILFVGMVCLAASIFVFIYLAGRVRYPYKYQEKLMSIALAGDSLDEVLSQRGRVQADVNPGIWSEEVLLPFDAESQTLYMVQSGADNIWLGDCVLNEALYEQGFRLYGRTDDYWKDKNQAIEDNHPFTLYMIGPETYYEFTLTVSYIPVIDIHTQFEKEPEKVSYQQDPDKFIYDSEIQYYGSMTLYLPEPAGEDVTKQTNYIHSNVEYHLKGSSTRVFDKKSYSIDLLDENWEKQNEALLGMRKDNSWKLNALTTDHNRIREITAAQIWEDINRADPSVEEPGPRLQYVEVVMDNEYQGLYCLVEPIDRKQCNLKDDEMLYKIVDWSIPNDDYIQLSVDQKWKVQTPIRIRFPKEITDYKNAWQPVRDYLNMFYRDTLPEYEPAADMLALENIMDIFIFNMVTSASDNHYKNLYLGAKRNEAGDYIIWHYPWDLDLSFGNVFKFHSRYYTAFSPDPEKVYMPVPIRQLLLAEPELAGKKLQERYQMFRNSFLNTEYINSLLKSNNEYLLKGGVLEREQTRWPAHRISGDIAALLAYQERRMEWLDGYFADIVQFYTEEADTVKKAAEAGDSPAAEESVLEETPESEPEIKTVPH